MRARVPDVEETPKKHPTCTTKRCRYCPKLNRKGRIKSTTSGREYASKTNVSCKSNNLIYCITCKKMQETVCRTDQKQIIRQIWQTFLPHNQQKQNHPNRETFQPEGPWGPIWHWNTYSGLHTLPSWVKCWSITQGQNWEKLDTETEMLSSIWYKHHGCKILNWSGPRLVKPDQISKYSPRLIMQKDNNNVIYCAYPPQ